VATHLHEAVADVVVQGHLAIAGIHDLCGWAVACRMPAGQKHLSLKLSQAPARNSSQSQLAGMSAILPNLSEEMTHLFCW